MEIKDKKSTYYYYGGLLENLIFSVDSQKNNICSLKNNNTKNNLKMDGLDSLKI